MDGFKSGISHEKLDDLFGGSPILSETSRWVNTTLEEINIRHFVSHVCYCLFLILLLICLFSYFFLHEQCYEPLVYCEATGRS